MKVVQRKARGIRRAVQPIAATLGLVLPASELSAQQAPEAEIVVTARKREEAASSVPLVYSVLGKDELDDRQASDLFDVAQMTPGLLLGASSIEVGTEISLRGVGASILDPGIDQSVALNLDGLQLGQGAAYSVGLFDMERIEILKGPQPLYFGKNSPGGVVAIRTADPSSRREFIARGGYEAEAREWRGDIILSGPATDTLSLRLVSQYAASDGYFRNQALAIPGTGAREPNKRFGDRKSFYLRGTAIYRPREGFTARLKLNATHDRSLGGVQAQLVHCPDGTFNYLPSIGIPIASLYSAREDCRADRDLSVVDLDPSFLPGIPNKGIGFTETDQRFGTLEIGWEFAPGLTLTSLSGFYHLDLDGLQNGPWSGGGGPPLSVIKTFGRKEANQELRINSKLDGPFDFTAGAFIQRAEIESLTSVPGNIGYGLPPVVLKGSHELDIAAHALWGELRFRPTSKLEISGGVRWTREKRTDDAITFDVSSVGGGAGGTPVRADLRPVKSSNWSPQIGFSWSPSAKLTLFGSVKQAYKSGSFNINLPLILGTDNSFEDERARGGEAGIRGNWARQGVSFSLAAYRYRYSGLQLGIAHETPSGIPTVSTLNAGSAKVQGLDLEFDYRPPSAKGLELSGAINWNHGRFTRFVNAPCYPGQTISEGCNLLPSLVTAPSEIAAGYFSIDPASGLPVRYNGQDLSGTPLPRAPRWQAVANVRKQRIRIGRMELGLGVSAQFSSRYLVNTGRRGAEAYQDGFAKFSANARLRLPDRRFEIAAIGNNLTDRLTTGSCYDVNYAGGAAFPGMVNGAPIKGPAGTGEILCAFERGRELWLRLTFHQR